MLRLSLCDYSDACVLVKGIAQVAAPPAADNNDKDVVFKNCSPFTDYISEINNTQIDNTRQIDVIIPMYELIEYSDNYKKHQEVYGNTVEMNQLWLMLVLSKKFMKVIIIVFGLNF